MAYYFWNGQLESIDEAGHYHESLDEHCLILMILSSDLIYEFIWELLEIVFLVFKVNFWLLCLFNTINVHC